MGIVYPDGIDSFNEPSLPEITPLSEAGTGSRNHVEHHHDLGAAITALQTKAAFKEHDHSGDPNDRAKGGKLKQAHTHEEADTDTARAALHHTISTNLPTVGTTGQYQAAPGNHIHDYNTLLNTPYIIVQTAPATAPVGTLCYEISSGTLRLYTGSGSSALGGNLLPVNNFPVCSLRQDAPQTIYVNGGAGTAVAWGTVSSDNYGMFNSGNNTLINIKQPGLYSIEVHIQWDTGFAPDNTYIRVQRNLQDTSVQATATLLNGAQSPGLSQTTSCTGQLRCNANDTLRVMLSYKKTGVLGGPADAINTFVGQFLNPLFGQPANPNYNINPTRAASRIIVTYISP